MDGPDLKAAAGVDGAAKPPTTGVEGTAPIAGVIGAPRAKIGVEGTAAPGSGVDGTLCNTPPGVIGMAKFGVAGTWLSTPIPPPGVEGTGTGV